MPVFFWLDEDDYTAQNPPHPDIWNKNRDAVIIRGASERSHSDYEAEGLEEAFIHRLGVSYDAAAAGAPARFGRQPQPNRRAEQENLKQLIEQAEQRVPEYSRAPG
ncbi:MAG: hypothetical protein LRY36_02405 [Alphaproteobacteria bacterium]|nr:hypothetical protein [Alphaproteobacteria bacterium]